MDNKNNISISKNAAEKIKNIISSQEKDVILKISVLGGGCAGFSYQFDLVKSLDKGDVLLEENGAKVLIDEVSIPYLEGSVIDYVAAVHHSQCNYRENRKLECKLCKIKN
jgi:iron-sulfur cluster assembly accessory protein